MKNLLKFYLVVCVFLAAVFSAISFILPSNVGEFYRYSPILITSIVLVDLMFFAHFGILSYSVLSTKVNRKDNMIIPKLIFENVVFLLILLLTCVTISLFPVIPVWINPIIAVVIIIINLFVILNTKGEIKSFFATLKCFFKNKILTLVIIPSIAIGVVFCVLLFTVIIPNSQYNKAIQLLNSGNYSAACDIFARISNYKDSSKIIGQLALKDETLKIYSANIGDTIKFGKYEQDDVIENGSEALEWTVLDKKNNKIFLLCNNCIEKIPYNNTLSNVTWENCTLRSWLNNDFYNSAFSDLEKEKIDSTRLINHDNPSYNVPKGGKRTTDKIFILSLNEGKFYLKNDSLLNANATTHVLNQNASTGAGNDYGVWWLRTPGATNSSAVTSHLHLQFSNMGYQVSHTLYSVRPALWIEL